MSKKSERIAIAKDVLSQIFAKKFIPKHGDYFHSLDEEFNSQLYGAYVNGEYVMPDQESQLRPPKKCEVCAIGCMFVSALDRNNKLQLKDSNVLGQDERMVNYLSDWFDSRQLRLMEVAFEGTDELEEFSKFDYHTDKLVYSSLGLKALTFHEKYRKDKRYGDNSAERLMRAMMNNVIKNDGTFKP